MVWDSVDCISALFRQAAQRSATLRSRLTARLELARTERYEGWATGQFDRVTVTSEIDAQELGQLSLRRIRQPQVAGRIVIVPNGVDLQYFVPAAEPRRPLTLVVTGKMSYHANVTAVTCFAKDVMPRIWRIHPAATLWIVGKNPPQEIRELGAWWSGKEPLDLKGCADARIQVTGTVDDVRPFLRRAALAVAPIYYGAGIQNKVLEALACGTPVVATPQAVSALRVRSGEDLVVAQDGQDFAESVSSLLSDPERQARLGAAGRRYVEVNHDWCVIGKRLAEVYRDADS
jgi:polysaccharide biosynthesis protein PslH